MCRLQQFGNIAGRLTGKIKSWVERAMSRFEYATPTNLTDHERQVLEAKRNVCFESIFGVSLRWIVVTDDKERKLFRLTEYSTPTTCYFEASLDEIKNMEDWQFKKALVAIERPCTDDQP
jgi:hypothetical protein